MFTTESTTGLGFKRQVAAVLLLLAFPGLGAGRVAQEPRPSAAQEDSAKPSWQQEFEEICSKTQDAMTLSPEELKSLIERCDALLPRLEKLDESGKKVYLGRLRMCRGLYVYVLDSKNNEKK